MHENQNVDNKRGYGWIIASIVAIALVAILSSWWNNKVFVDTYERVNSSTGVDNASDKEKEIADLVKDLSTNEFKLYIEGNFAEMLKGIDDKSDPKHKETVFKLILLKSDNSNSADGKPLDSKVYQSIIDSVKTYYTVSTERSDREFKYYSSLIAVVAVALAMLGYKSIKDYREELEKSIELKSSISEHKLQLVSNDMNARAQQLFDDLNSKHEKIGTVFAEMQKTYDELLNIKDDFKMLSDSIGDLNRRVEKLRIDQLNLNRNGIVQEHNPSEESEVDEESIEDIKNMPEDIDPIPQKPVLTGDLNQLGLQAEQSSKEGER